MNYDAIILKMLSRIQILKQQVKGLTERQGQLEDQTNSTNAFKRISTKEIVHISKVL